MSFGVYIWGAILFVGGIAAVGLAPTSGMHPNPVIVVQALGVIAIVLGLIMLISQIYPALRR